MGYKIVVEKKQEIVNDIPKSTTYFIGIFADYYGNGITLNETQALEVLEKLKKVLEPNQEEK